MKKYKPKAKIKVFTAYWWNPLFWIVIITLPFIWFFIGGIKNFYDCVNETIKEYKSWDLT